MPTRRSYLAGITTICAGGFAGCTALGGSKSFNQVEMDNNTGRDIEALVEVTNDTGETLFRRSFTIEAGNQDEGAEWFEGSPAKISVAVDDAQPLTAEWSSQTIEVNRGERPKVQGESPCVRGGDSMTGVFVRVASAERMWVEPTCGDPQ